MAGVRRTWWICCALLGVAATALFLLTRTLRDGTQLTYAAAVLAFWWLLPTVVLLVPALLRRRWVVSATLVVPAVAWLWVFGPLFLPGAPAAVASDGAVELRVATFNVSPRNGSAHVVAFAERVQPDVLMLQEVRPKARRTLVPQLEQQYPYQWFAKVTWNAPGGGGVGVLSRYPITRVDPVVGLPERARPTGIVHVDVDGRELSVLPLHLASPCANCILEDVTTLADVGQPTAIRRVETARILEALPPGPVIVGGDLNSSVLNEPVEQFRAAGLTDVFRAVGWGPGFTRGAHRDVSRIDFLLAGGGVRAQRSHVDRPDGSDHRPVVADVVLPG